MGKNRNSKTGGKGLVVAVSLLLCTFIAIGIFAYLYLATDTFESTEAKYFGYLEKVVGNESSFLDEELKKYIYLKEEAMYTETTDIDIEFQTPNISENVNIIIDSKINPKTDLELSNIDINYSDDITFPFIYKKIDGIEGIQSDYIAGTYIAEDVGDIEKYYDVLGIRNELEEFNSLLANVNLDIFNIELSESLVMELMSAIPDNKYSITSENIEVGLNVEEYTKIVELIEKEQTVELPNIKEDIVISISFSSGKANKIELVVDGEKSSLEKTIDNSAEVEYTYIKETEFASLSIKQKYLKTDADSKVFEEIIEISYQNKNNEKLNISVGKSVVFAGSDEFEEFSSIPKFTKEDTTFLTGNTEESINNFLKLVEDRLIDVSNTQMADLGKQTNPLSIIANFELAFKDSNSSNESEDTDSDSDSDSDTDIDTENETEPDSDENRINSYNKNLEAYQSTNLDPQTVKGLLTEIEVVNEENKDLDIELEVKEIHFNGTEYDTSKDNLDKISSQIDLEAKYKVEFEKEEDTGKIYRAIITVK